jgi:diguanylate cyclase (GGDEF)-like protein
MRFRHLRTPSFRARLRLFFLIIVVVPMITLAVVLFDLISRSEDSQTDARLATAQTTAQTAYQEEAVRAGEVAGDIGGDQGLANALADDDRKAAQSRLETLAAQYAADFVRLQLDRQGTLQVGSAPAMAPTSRRVLTADNTPAGKLTVAMRSPDEFAARVNKLTGADVVIRSRGGARLATTEQDVGSERLPVKGPVDVGGVDYRARSFDLGAIPRPVRVSLLMQNRQSSPTSRTSVIALAAFVAFLILASMFAVAVSRRLQSEIQRLLDAAERLGEGDFSVTVPAEGNDEFAALGRQFNSMARQLEGRLEELQRERARLQEAIRRVGESFAAGLDRANLLEIVVQTAVDGIGAACGRATMRHGSDGRLQEVARAGDPHAFLRALHAAEAAVIDAGQVAEIQLGSASALAAPLGANEQGDRVSGIVSVARGDRAFTHGERELFAYLTNQASVSVENVDLHETVQRQAVTDELTGLFNHRRFQEVMAIEVERARRYGHEMGLIMLDIDNFKQVNDVYGHLQGDMVLREVARVLRQSSREIDEPARYGGEEMAVALPQTDLEGAYQFAERVRRAVEGIELPLPTGNRALRVTASFGVASLATADRPDKDALVAAADRALYEAKRAGKNRTVRAPTLTARGGVHGVASTE